MSRLMGIEKKSFWDEVILPVDNSWRTFDKFKHPRTSETAAADKCVKCHSAIWTLWSRSGFLTRLDTEPVTPAQDLEFYLAQRRTYRVFKTGGGFEIDYRTNNAIKADQGKDIVLAEHICDKANIRTDWPDYFPRHTATETEEIPF